MDTSGINEAIAQTDRLRRLIKLKKTRQVTALDECALIRAHGLSWFHSYKTGLAGLATTAEFERLERAYQTLVSHSDHKTTRRVYDRLLKDVRADLIALRAAALLAPVEMAQTSDAPVSFQSLTHDVGMQTVLAARWDECVRCLDAGAPLAATVMMGGLLEAILLARVNQEANPAAVFKATSAPRDQNQKTRPLKEWGLRDYIEVSHELGWITVSAKDVGAVLRDYRNYIHPSKQYTHKVMLTPDDALILWEVAKAITRQVLRLVPI